MNLIFKVLTILVLMLSTSKSTFAQDINHGNLSNVNMPEIFKNLLSSGMPIAAKIKYINNLNLDSHLDGIIEANIFLRDNKLKLSYIDVKDETFFTKHYNDKLNKITDKEFDGNGRISIDGKSYLLMNISKMELSLYITKDDFSKVAAEREIDIGESSVDDFSSLVSYNFGLSNSWGNNENYNNNYLNINSITGVGENHIVIDGSFFGIGQSNQAEDLRRVMYEKDYNSRRFAFGILSGWDLQSLGQVNALKSKRIWGMSYGNKSNSTHIDETKSYTPIFVFLPSQGEIRVYKDKRLISIQNFGLGNHEIDTTSFPGGNYNVTVDIVVNGKKISSNVQKVNKSSYTSGFSKELSWQVWGGFMEPYDNYFNDKDVIDDPTYLIGTSHSLSFDNSYLTSSFYSFDNTFLSEFQLDSKVTNWLGISNQLMFASDGSWQTINTATVDVFRYGSIWGTFEKSNYGKKINDYDSDSYGYGGSLNLAPIHDILGNLTISRQIDRSLDSDYLTMSYFQKLYTGSYGSLSLNLDYYYNKFNYYNMEEKSITLEYSIPLGQKIRAGVSKDATGSLTADLSYDDSNINDNIIAIGASLSSQLEGTHDLYASSYLNYTTNYLDGSVNMSRSIDGNYATNLSGNGSLSLTNNGVNATGGDDGDAGIIIKTNLDDDKTIEASIDGQKFPITGKETLVTLSGYKKYNIKLNNNQNVKDNFEISDKKRNITLYPGNIYTFDVSDSIREMVTVFGVLKDSQGNTLSNVKAYNHIGSTVTDSDGNFVIDVNKNIPIMSSYDASGNVCEAQFNLTDKIGAVWIGDIICKGDKSYASNN